MVELERKAAVARLIESTRAQLNGQLLTAHALEKVLEQLRQLATMRDYWSADWYPPPKEGELQARYLISEEPDQSYALYLNVMRPGKRIPPHNHTTWACVAAVSGCEINYVYERLDDRSRSGHARIREVELVRVEPGTGIALLPDDIHSVEVKAGDMIRHLHFYGRALETLRDRLVFDPETETCKTMQLSVQSIR
jgi:predicted metal-dependent enzyme (double-stranded beta helix superfamily)